MSDLADMAGEIRVCLTVGGADRVGVRAEDARIRAVDIRSTRPVAAARVFEGKPAGEMCARIGRIFSLCGSAQSVAALMAVETALAIAPDPRVSAARDALRRAEMLTQIVTRLALHWPRVLGLPLAPEAVRAAMAAEHGLEAAVLGSGWRQPGAGIAGGRASAPVIDAAALADPLAEALARRGLEGYGALPDGMAPEHGVLARGWSLAPVAAARAAHGAGLAARLAAARAALETLPGEIAAALAAAGPAPARAALRDSGTGEATVATARGPLTHRVAIAGGLVTRCRTEAPTEPNFAANGPVAAGLVGAAADPVAAELHVLAIDPCVACRLELAPR
ncbi:MAG: hypothetical protein CSA74_08605 [Rhodobacterales bacterium]|nr:MAG: hypothetical protein CSA74_08605 [Rhodobacterales bacterium]